jgi:hypothetical protein
MYFFFAQDRSGNSRTIYKYQFSSRSNSDCALLVFVHLPGCGDYMSALEVSNNKKLVASFFASKLATFALKNLSVSCLKELI